MNVSIIAPEKNGERARRRKKEGNSSIGKNSEKKQEHYRSASIS